MTQIREDFTRMAELLANAAGSEATLGPLLEGPTLTRLPSDA